MSAPEFSRVHDIRKLPSRPLHLEASEAEREALAARFELVRIDTLAADVTLEADGDTVALTGALAANIVQSCAVSGDDLEQTIAEEIAIRFVPERAVEEEELELDEDDLDEISYEGHQIDVGEAVAQSLALAIDPYATGPDADTVRKEVDLAEPTPEGPLQQALKGLKQG